MKARLDDDIYPVEMPYHSPSADAIYMALNFAKDINAIFITYTGDLLKRQKKIVPESLS